MRTHRGWTYKLDELESYEKSFLCEIIRDFHKYELEDTENGN